MRIRQDNLQALGTRSLVMANRFSLHYYRQLGTFFDVTIPLSDVPVDFTFRASPIWSTLHASRVMCTGSKRS
jgi:hypothetical protein